MLADNLTVKPFVLISTIAAMIQVAPVQADWAIQAEHLTLTGALIIAVAVLWKSLAAKDIQLVTNTKTVTEALAAAAVSNAELRRIIDSSVQANQLLATSIAELRKTVEDMNTVQRVLNKG
jgi:hypothetical protein